MLPRGLRRLSMSTSLPRRPLMVIVGATGTGKSELAVSLAERFNGEIINGDALQMYEGLPITTNKIPIEERKEVPHHLLGCVKLEDEPWTVRQFHDGASRIIEEIRSRGKLPILVGGTHYYTQSLLFPKSLVEEGEQAEHVAEDDLERMWPILSASTQEMLDMLRKVDPVMAQRWHPKDRRKIRRSLQIWLQTGKRASDIYDGQRNTSRAVESDAPEISAPETVESPENPKLPKNLGDFGGPCSEKAGDVERLGRHDALIFWTYSSSDVLNQRLDKRVDSMISNGLLDEVQSMHTFLKTQAQHGNVIDDARGIWIAIGFKEMLSYVTSQSRSEEAREEGIERTKIATRQYAKRQNRWIRLTLLHALKKAGLRSRMFLLDATDVSQFSSNVEHAAGEVASSFLNGRVLPDPSIMSNISKEMLLTEEKQIKSARYCEACDKTVVFEHEWQRHLKSKGHRHATSPKVDWKALYPTIDK